MATTQETDLVTMEDGNKCISYRKQSGKAVSNSEHCIFRICEEDAEDPLTMTEWKAEAGKMCQTQQSYWKDPCFRCVIRSEEFKAVCVIGENGLPPSSPTLVTY